ncbi:MAG: hypothetical protein PHS27_01660 [Candidatus Pacebacteria bacterium]|nr:hypothetical protein [Candidatus Paceibacterota bacterium]
MAVIERSALKGKVSDIAIPDDSILQMLYECLDQAGIEYAVIKEDGEITLYVASFDEINVRGIIEYLRSKKA